MIIIFIQLMRKFSIIVTSIVIAVTLFSTAIAATGNNTKTKIENKSEVQEENITQESNEQIVEEELTEAERIEKEKREGILARWKEKQIARWNNLPKGKFTINASAYTAAADECGKSDGITASGVKVQEKRTLACPKEYPFGAKLEIEGMGTYTCEDRGGAIKGNKFDIYMETKGEAFAFGRRNLTAEFVQ